ncbi:hypothetical protein ARMSODRAFT_799209 [Armillaria solidipes]|uniref:Uncharacterized protein n=1 Tax=Armillaria solidipes TaxID=1076256 RepID=A0A2H3B4D2_9AGAR|nr:hypothetical protein ARMSODRAFT_799209 [Armillaria solidipes]
MVSVFIQILSCRRTGKMLSVFRALLFALYCLSPLWSMSVLTAPPVPVPQEPATGIPRPHILVFDARCRWRWSSGADETV